jgi:cell pole-organizing protein PopZ
MAQLPSAFNSADHGDMQNFSALPTNDYVSVITESKMKAAKKDVGGSHLYLELTHEVLQGKHKGQKFWNRLNLKNPSQQAVNIANETLATICRAVGIAACQDSQALHGKPMIVSVKLKEATATNPASNDITFYKSLSAGGASASTETSGAKSNPYDDDDGDTPSTTEVQSKEAATTNPVSKEVEPEADHQGPPWNE